MDNAVKMHLLPVYRKVPILVIPEVKYVCLCAALGWPHAVHVYDPVD